VVRYKIKYVVYTESKLNLLHRTKLKINDIKQNKKIRKISEKQSQSVKAWTIVGINILWCEGFVEKTWLRPEVKE